MTTPHDIVTHARTWIGATWRHQGRGYGPNRGIDCAGLLLRVAQHFDLPNGDLQGYRRNPHSVFIDNIRRWTDPYDGLTPIHGAIGIFTDGVQPCHTGIFATDFGVTTLIHSEAAPRRLCHEQHLHQTGRPLAENLFEIRLFKGVTYE